VRDPRAPSTTVAELREGARVTVAAPPVLVRDHAGSAALVLPVPDALRGQPALLTVLARPLAPSPLVRIETDEVEVPPGARLVFGYGVEEPGWAAGWPPARFRVSGPGDATLFERRLDPAADPRDRRWFDASVDLASVAGRRVRLAFETEALGHAPGAMVDRTFAVVANPTIVAPPPAAAGPRNVVLVSLDTLRARSVSAYGCRRTTTPGLDQRVAAAGALVRFAVAPVPFTPPSHMSMLTGLDPCAHGVRDLQGALAPERVTLAEALRAAGYATAAFTEDAYLVAGNGFDRGFDVYRENRSEESASPGFAAETFADATSWLSAHATEPFFLFVHTYQVHEPYTPPRGYAGLFTDGDQVDEHQQALANYEREVRYTDDLFGGVLDALETGGVAERTILVVTSDHGEGFAEHFWSGHGFDLHDEALLVPLLVRAPGLVPAGRVVEEQVGLVDLTPTLLDLVGLPPPPDVQGRSFARLLTGRGAAFEERPVVCAALTKSESVRTRRWKYVTAPQGELYYDVAADPLEQRDRAAADPAGVAAARAVLEAAHAACTQWNEAHPRGAPPTGAAGGEPAWMINREEVERKLRSLGYAQ
jgi:arylsulfatase A-like enzyme